MRGFGLLALFALGCGAPAGRRLVYGSDECARCHMTLIDPRYAALLVTRTGRTIPFDDIGCLGGSLADGDVAPSEVREVRVADFLAPDSMIPAESAVFLASDRAETPMRHGIIATAAGSAADSLRAALGATLLTWPEVVARQAEHPGR